MRNSPGPRDPGSATLQCDGTRRREAVRAKPGWNGLDFVEVDQAQTTITVYFLGKVPDSIDETNVTIEGGRTERDAVRVISVDVQRDPNPYIDDRMLVHLDRPGDFSTYTLRIAGIENFDARYSAVPFSFKVDCPADLDCADQPPCPTPLYPRPEIDRLAKDYASFRQLILDRLSLTTPEWTERLIPDLGITLVELLAYTGDYLSYYQDAVATEAYIGTARRRPSVRRHARLVDYALNEGCNARTLVTVEVGAPLTLQPADLYFITAMNGALPIGEKHAVPEREIEGFEPAAYEVFEPMLAKAIGLWSENNSVGFYTWGGRECCLSAGATRATLRGPLAGGESGGVHLSAGDFLILEEVLGPKSGNPADADPAHRHAVRLTSVEAATDPLTGDAVIEIAWDCEDKLPFDLCLSAIGTGPECRFIEDISVARGNAVLVDHGRTLPPELLGTVPLKRTEACCECEGHPAELTPVAGRFRPQLRRQPITWRQPLRGEQKPPAAKVLVQDPRCAHPVVHLQSIPPTPDGSGPLFEWDDLAGREAQLRDWIPVRDLLAAAPDMAAFVVEMEEDGTAGLLFGNGAAGARPAAGESYRAQYRIGRGPAGNVGAESISVLVHRASDLKNDIAMVRNPLPALGGVAPEPLAAARLNAPHAFRHGPNAMQRAIIADDYAVLAERNAKLQQAAARLNWTGSWFEASLAVDPFAAESTHESAILTEVERQLERYRRIGHELRAYRAVRVPLVLGLRVCLEPQYLQGHVRRALLDAFSNRVLAGGKLGFFHPDRLTFGADIYLSAIVAEAQNLPGVASVEVTALHRQFLPSNHEIENGVLALGHLEIAQLDNDPNYPDRGRLILDIRGGR